jgi:hypothetical protein
MQCSIIGENVNTRLKIINRNANQSIHKSKKPLKQRVSSGLGERSDVVSNSSLRRYCQRAVAMVQAVSLKTCHWHVFFFCSQ